MNAVTKTDHPRPMLLDGLAARYGLQPQEFASTVRKTCGLGNASAEEFAAFIMVAKEYGLNPLLKEIHAFPKRGGGIVPVVSIDGWVNLVNSHPKCDGFTFHMEHDRNGDLVACTCRMYRKDRQHPVEVTEYLAECKRDTEPWKMKHRMLRHKAMIQAARYAFGFSGIYDEDEGARIAEARDVTPPPAPPAPPSPPAPPAPPSPPSPAAHVSAPPEADGGTKETATASDDEAGNADAAETDPNEFFEKLEEALAGAMDAETVEEVWADFDPEAEFDGDDVSIQIAFKIRDRRMKQVSDTDIANHPMMVG